MGRDISFDDDFAPAASFLDPNGSVLQDEIAPGEAIRWQGQPEAGTMLVRSLPISVGGLFFGGFAVFWMITASAAPGGGWIALFGIPFLGVGGTMVLSPLWAAFNAQRTRYAVTDRRVILCEPSGLGIQVRSYAPEALANMVRTQRSDGSGDLIFEEIRTRDRDGDRRITRRGFQAIPDVRRVEALIRSTLLDERP